MIHLYSWNTSNGKKISVALEEMGLSYEFHPINISKDEQFQPHFLKISPNNRIPAIIDTDGPNGSEISVFESGAILIYLAEKTGKFMPRDAHKRIEVLEWLMWQMGGLGPMQGQAHHFRRAAKEQVPYGIKRYTDETNRLYGVLNKRLEGRDFICSDISIADFACIGWVSRWEWVDIDWGNYPNLKAWFDRMMARPAVAKGMDIQAV
ncbi:MAG: glutathione binding-like protein [Rhodospirillales bacterium]|jgi:GST-like protein